MSSACRVMILAATCGPVLNGDVTLVASETGERVFAEASAACTGLDEWQVLMMELRPGSFSMEMQSTLAATSHPRRMSCWQPR